MCLRAIDNKIKWNSKFKTFWKKFNRENKILTGYYQKDYNYNIGWNYPTSLKIEKIGTDYFGGGIHVCLKRINNDYAPVIALKDDLIVNNTRDAMFKKIYIPSFVYKYYSHYDYEYNYHINKIIADFYQEHKWML